MLAVMVGASWESNNKVGFYEIHPEDGAFLRSILTTVLLLFHVTDEETKKHSHSATGECQESWGGSWSIWMTAPPQLPHSTGTVGRG
jgi:hypothetical protein